MKSIIYKYLIPTRLEFAFRLPEGAEILKIDLQNGDPYLWAKIDRQRPEEFRTFRLVFTGHTFDDTNLVYHDTFQLENGGIVFHLYEVTQ